MANLLPPLKPIPIKERLSVLYIEKGHLDARARGDEPRSRSAICRRGEGSPRKRGTVLESPAPEIARGVFWLQSIDAFVVSWTQRREDRETGESGRRAVGRAGSDAGRAALGDRLRG